MKNKLKWIVNLSTLALCICALAIGVYAAKQSSLTTNGTIGFNAHGCDINVSGYITGHAESADSAIVTTQVPLSANVRGSATDLALGTRYFSDLTEDGSINNITISLTFTNISQFNVEIYLDNANITLPTGVTLTPNPSYVVLDKEGGTDTSETIEFTLSLASTSEDFTASTNNLQIKLNMGKTDYNSTSVKKNVSVGTFTETEKAPLQTAIGTGKETYMTRFPQYVTMGTYGNTNQKLRWLVIGVDNGSNEMLAITSGSEEQTLLAKGGMLANKSYYLLSEYALASMCFQNAYTYTNDAYRATVDTTKYSNDYSVSTIRTFLKGEEAVQVGTNAGTPTGESIKLSDVLTFTTTETEQILPRDLTDVGATGDKLWLLSLADAKTIAGLKGVDENPCPSLITYMFGGETLNGWWLRDAYQSIGSGNYGVEVLGSEGMAFELTVHMARSIRPALKLK